MGVMETELKKKVRRTRISKIILCTIAGVGLLSVALLAPNAVQVMKMFESGEKRKKLHKSRIKTALNRLISEGAIRKVEKNNKLYFELTPKGQKKLGDLYRYQLVMKKPKKWDGKWRIVSFDIYEKRRDVRDKLRRTLKSVGFLQLHQSMWIYPYDCEDLVTLLKSDLRMGRNVLYIIADRVEADTKLKKHFDVF